MTTAALKTCAANQWTLIASGASTAVAIQFRSKSEKGALLVTNSNVDPGTKSESQPWLYIGESTEPNNIAAASTDYFWFQPSGDKSVNLTVWVG